MIILWIWTDFAAGEETLTSVVASVLLIVMNNPVADCPGTTPRTQGSMTVTSAQVTVATVARAVANASLIVNVLIVIFLIEVET